MVTLLDCIKRFSTVSDSLLEKREETFRQLIEVIDKSGKMISRIILCGSGSSYNETVTARGFIEKVTGKPVTAVLPNELLHNTYVYDADALYVFVSQSGTSTLTQQAADLVRSKGAVTACVTAFPDNPLAGKVDAYIEQGVGKEEYGFVTIGFDTGVFTLMLMGLQLGKHFGSINEQQYQQYLDMAARLPESQKSIIEKTMAWFDLNKEQLLRTATFTIYGAGPLYGIALEAALKILEVAKRNVSVGYEIDDGMHGPTMGYTYANCVIGLNDGGVNADKFASLVRWDKEVMFNGFMFGKDPIDDKDLAFDCVAEDFRALEYAPAIQVLAYRLAVDIGVDLTDRSRHQERKYFATHDVKKR